MRDTAGSPERAKWLHLARSGQPAVSRKKTLHESHIISPLLTKFVLSRWLDIGQVLFLRVYSQKRTRPIPSHLDRTNLVNKGFIIWLSGKSFLRDTAGSPKQARWSHLAHSGSQSKCAIWLILPAHGATHIITRLIIWLAPRAGNMNEIARCDWLPERARWSDLARSELPAVSRKQNFPKSHIINPLLTKFVRSRWLDIGLVLFLRVYGPRLRLGP